MSTRPATLTEPYGAYKRAALRLKEDEELTHVGPGTPGGEYLRRYWHPVAFTSSLKDLPLRIRILGEDLALFKDLSGRIGLLALHCTHRGTSLEFGVIRDRGISCCYHGWQFDIDGRIIEIPNQPPGSTLKEELCHGAYPVHEYKGLVFAYMGPPEKKPAFPILDSFNLEGYQLKPWGGYVFPCNWVQAKENCMDPVHTQHLHTIPASRGFTPSFAAEPEVEFRRVPSGTVYIAARRIEDNVWIRMTNLIMPNIHQLAATWEDGKCTKAMTRPMQTIWAVPLDDVTTMNIGFNHYGESGSDVALLDVGADFGQYCDRPYAERQRVPGDYDAQSSIGPISVHASEYLTATDNGVVMFRNALANSIRSCQKGQEPAPAQLNRAGEVISYANNTILRIPKSGGDPEDRKMMRTIGLKVFESLPNRDLGELNKFTEETSLAR